MNIGKFIRKVKLKKNDAVINFTYYADVSSWRVNIAGYHLPTDIPLPINNEDVDDYLDSIFAVFDQKTSKTDTDLILITKEGDEILLKKNISLYQKTKILSEDSEKWRFWNLSEAEHKVKLRHVYHSVPTKGVILNREDPNFYFKEKEYK